MENIDHKKYKWFYTLSGKLVVGGKSAEQNDELLRTLQKSREDLIIMHTSSPGSPFSIILASINNITKEDLEECAIFTACFSKSWKDKKKKEKVDIFRLSQVKKAIGMKTGTWAVKGHIEHKEIPLALTLTFQKSILRAVPEKSAKKKLLKISPGNIDKADIVQDIQKYIPDVSKEDILSALPAGGIKIQKYKK